MPCDSDPSGRNPVDVVAAIFDLEPAACPKCGALPSDACAKTGKWCEDVSRRLAARNSRWSPITVSNKTVTQQPAAPISPQEIAEMRRGLAAARAGSDADFALYAYASTARLPHLLDAIEALTAERDALKGEVRTMMRRGSERMGLVCWYAAHRAKVEAAHAAAKDAGIDMALLGKLCREEPDEAAKREVEAMMDGLYAAMGDSALSDPAYPAMKAEALRQVKAGD